VIQAHSTSLECLALSNDGSRLATASAKGTVICIFDVPSCSLVQTLRRGLVSSAQVYSLSFSFEATMLAVSSDKETIHIFKLDRNIRKNYREGRTVGSLTDKVANLWESTRDFAHIKFRTGSMVKNVCALSRDENATTHRVLVATYDGFLHHYNLDPNKGGECVLVQTYPLFPPPEQQQQPASSSWHTTTTTTTPVL
jgi:autophagy-related protein 18